MAPLKLPLRTGLLLALFSALALGISIGGLVLVDREARRLEAATGAARDLAEIEAKLPGALADPQSGPLVASALAEIGQLAGETQQPRFIFLRGADGTVRGETAIWPTDARPYQEKYQLFTARGVPAAGVARRLGDGAELLIGRPVPGSAPVRTSLTIWGLAAAVLLLGLSAATGITISRQTTRRIARMNALCERVEEGDVDARLPEEAPVDELEQLGRHMNRMLEELARRLDALRSASDNLAHDLRTPLSRVQGHLSRVESLALKSDNVSAAEEAALASIELDRLMRAFNALLDLREIETEPTSPPQFFDLALVIADAVELHEAVAEDQKGVRIERRVAPCRMRGHASLVLRAVANLVDNAVKVSPRGAVVLVESDCDAREVRIRVIDEGPGFPSFSRSPSTLGGHGIGLSIVRAVARRHGGRLETASGATGATVTLILRK
ncbi:HAMP domain-containing histidine kinase [Pacificimonas sp. WHA3]|uniref:histidine kinase n=1 Tax=Pacificimonas pallii TaxID=2827236 RepID=A0ABS6SER0_9SPHN|nr:HAMP domain-containing sensor histidine kinase [Pacificimonas pallii]MBV7256882.1 HAMP domain-containing histidine kinase [Pacificimonas pallii]